jgi:hypothetical protein
MTNEEMERAIDFILKSQARSESRVEQAEERQARTDEQLRQLAERLDSFAETQANIMRVMTQTLEAQSKINESVQATLRELTVRQSRADDAMARMAEAQASSARRLEALIKVVEEGRRGDG